MADKDSRPAHVYITEVEIKVGSMGRGDKYSSFTTLCAGADPFSVGGIGGVLGSAGTPPPQFRRYRSHLSIREHWYNMQKPTCQRCELLQALLRGNVPKADRPAFTLLQFRALMQSIEGNADASAAP